MKIKQYWKDKWEPCTVHLVNTFFFLKCLSQGKGECCSRRTKDFWKFHCNALFPTGSFFCQSMKKSQQTGNETAALSFFLFVFFIFVFMTDRLGSSLSKLSPSLHKLLSNPMELLQGSNLSEVPISFWHIDVLRDLEEELIPPALASLFFLSVFLSPNFTGSCAFLGRQTPSWRECSVQHWLETTVVREAEESLGNLSWSRGSKAKRHCDTGDYK